MNSWIKNGLVLASGCGIGVAFFSCKIVKTVLNTEEYREATTKIISRKIDTLLYGESIKEPARSSRVSYRSYHDSKCGTYENVVFETRKDAERALDSMCDVVQCYGVVSVADLYDIAGITVPNYHLSEIGWHDLSLAKVVRTRNGYTLSLPKALAI